MPSSVTSLPASLSSAPSLPSPPSTCAVCTLYAGARTVGATLAQLALENFVGAIKELILVTTRVAVLLVCATLVPGLVYRSGNSAYKRVCWHDALLFFGPAGTVS